MILKKTPAAMTGEKAPPVPVKPMSGAEKRIFLALFFSIFGAVTGVGIVVPLLPVYADSMGASGLYIGLIFGAFSLSRTFFLPYFGRRSDHRGRKPLIVTGLLGYSLISVSFILAKDVETLIGIRFIQGIASAMIMPVTQAYVGDITPKGREGFTMGMFNFSTFLGLGFGPVLGGIIKDRIGLEFAFYSMGVLALAGAVLSMLFLPPTRLEPVSSHRRGLWSWRRILSDAETVGLVVYRFAYTACIGIIWGFLPVWGAGTFLLSSARIGVLVMLGVMVSGVFQLPMGIVADRVSRKALVVAGGAVVALAMLLYPMATGFWSLAAVSTLFGLGGGISMPALMGMAVQKGERARAMGSIMALMTVGHSFGMLFGSFIGGLAMDIWRLERAFPAGAFVMGISIAAFLLLNRSGYARRSLLRRP